MQDRIHPRPNLGLSFAEGPRVLTELATLMSAAPLLSLAPRGDGQPVLVLPGFGGGDRSTRVIREYLTRLGYPAQPWELGVNLGPAMANLAGELAARLDQVYRAGGERKVSLVGWSLGGVYARLLAHQYPDKVRQVITLGSPFAGSPRSTRAYRVASMLYGGPLEQSPTHSLRLLAGDPLPGVPSTAIFSKTDGVVPWRIAVEQPTDLAENIEVFTSHLGLGFNASVLFAMADRLALGEDAWRPFKRDGWKAFAYGSARLDDEAVAPAAD